MELRVLRYFLIVAREENITKAAQLLHITQPSLSRQLMQLEEELEVKLFRRGKHSIILTEEGLLLRRRAEEIVTLADKAKQDFIHREEYLAGEISIGSGEVQSMSYFSQMVMAFQEKHPLVKYHLFSANADSIKEHLEKGLLDLGLLLEPVEIGKYEFVRIPITEQFGVITREDSPLANKTEVTPKELCGVPLLLPGRALVQNELFNWFDDYLEQIKVSASFNLLYNAAMMVQEGLGSAVAVKLNSSFEGLRFIPLSPRLEMSTVLVWKKHQIQSPTVNAFLEHAKAYTQNAAFNDDKKKGRSE